MLALLIKLYNNFCHNILNRRMYAKVSGQYLNMIGCDEVYYTKGGLKAFVEYYLL